MRAYIVQARADQSAPLMTIGQYRAKTSAHAIRNATAAIIKHGDQVMELVATETDPVGSPIYEAAGLAQWAQRADGQWFYRRGVRVLPGRPGMPRAVWSRWLPCDGKPEYAHYVGTGKPRAKLPEACPCYTE